MFMFLEVSQSVSVFHLSCAVLCQICYWAKCRAEQNQRRHLDIFVTLWNNNKKGSVCRLSNVPEVHNQLKEIVNPKHLPHILLTNIHTLGALNSAGLPLLYNSLFWLILAIMAEDWDMCFSVLIYLCWPASVTFTNWAVSTFNRL